jgi:hypothetical protein
MTRKPGRSGPPSTEAKAKLKEVDRRLCELLRFIRGMEDSSSGSNPVIDEIPEAAHEK